MNSIDPYITCPVYETKDFILRLVRKEDATQLLECYSDQQAVAIMDADNCLNDFYYPTIESMQKAIDFWIMSYENRYFIRFSILEKATEKVLGTIEIFGGGVGVLRIDIASEYEKEDYLTQLFALAEKEFYRLMKNYSMVTKAIPIAIERRKSLMKCNWEFIDQFRVYNNFYEKKA